MQLQWGVGSLRYVSFHGANDPLPSYIHYELLLQLLERKTMFAVSPPIAAAATSSPTYYYIAQSPCHSKAIRTKLRAIELSRRTSLVSK